MLGAHRQILMIPGVQERQNCSRDRKEQARTRCQLAMTNLEQNGVKK